MFEYDVGTCWKKIACRGGLVDAGLIVSMRNGGCDMSMRLAASCFQFMIRSLECLS